MNDVPARLRAHQRGVRLRQRFHIGLSGWDHFKFWVCHAKSDPGDEFFWVRRKFAFLFTCWWIYLRGLLMVRFNFRSVSSTPTTWRSLSYGTNWQRNQHEVCNCTTDGCCENVSCVQYFRNDIQTNVVHNQKIIVFCPTMAFKT